MYIYILYCQTSAISPSPDVWPTTSTAGWRFLHQILHSEFRRALSACGSWWEVSWWLECSSAARHFYIIRNRRSATRYPPHTWWRSIQKRHFLPSFSWIVSPKVPMPQAAGGWRLSNLGFKLTGIDRSCHQLPTVSKAGSVGCGGSAICQELRVTDGDGDGR